MSDEISVRSEHALSDVIRDVKNAVTNRSDVVVGLCDANRVCLELFVVELELVFADAHKNIDNFDFAISLERQYRL